MRRMALLGMALLLAAPAMPARADGIDLGTIVGAGLGGVIGNQIGKGTGNTVATVAGVILGGVAGHTVDRSWDSGATRYRSYNTGGYVAAPVNYRYVPNYVAPPAPPPATVVYYNDRYNDRHHGRGPHWQQPVVYQQTYVQQNVVPVSYQQPVQQQYCREYNNTVVVGGQLRSSYGTACMQPDGSWQIIN